MRMLKLFRKKIVSRIILWGLLILILPAFVMWGSASMSRSKDKGPNYAGIVNGHKVSFDELYNAISGVRTQIILSYFSQPKALDALLGNKPLIAKIAWDRLLLLYEAKKMWVKASDKEVIAAIKIHPLFIRNGAFDEKFYSYMLRNNIGLEARAFEEIVRDNLIIQKLSLKLTDGMKITDEDVSSEYKKEFAKLKIAYILMDLQDTLGQVKVAPEAIKDYYEKHKSELMLKSNLKGALADRPATFDESKDTIERYLREAEARKLLRAKSEEVYKKLAENTGDKPEAFESAAALWKLTLKNTDFFSRTDKLDDISDVGAIARIGSFLKESEISKPVELAKGIIIFKVVGRQASDEEAFKKEKDEYAKKVRARRVDQFMAEYLKKLEIVSKPAIKFEEIEKYYR